MPSTINNNKEMLSSAFNIYLTTEFLWLNIFLHPIKFFLLFCSKSRSNWINIIKFYGNIWELFGRKILKILLIWFVRLFNEKTITHVGWMVIFYFYCNLLENILGLDTWQWKTQKDLKVQKNLNFSEIFKIFF